MESVWEGPFAWPNTESILPGAPSTPGVYLWTFEYADGFLLYGAGITRRPVSTRLREHTRGYLNGVYTILDVDALRDGKRVEHWHGFWTKARPRERVAEYEVRRLELEAAARRQLSSFRIFVVDVGTAPRILERFEAAVMQFLYAQPNPLCDIPDRGMMLAPRHAIEEPIEVVLSCQHRLYGLPAEFAI
ncbi:MAG: hypothetical protein IPP90_14515 [Gemmatimonadaceae bacterium]|nr:hypothetical protein [Gemmatimonadaceae bacterium]